MLSSPLLVCRTAWMDHYRGVSGDDRATGGGAWVDEHGFGSEVFNFKPVRGTYFGFAQATGAGVNLTRLGGSRGDEKLEGVTVAWVATHPAEGGMRIVGWYRDATVYAEYQSFPKSVNGRRMPDGETPSYLVRSQDAMLLDRDARVLEVPRGSATTAGMGQSNLWYPDRDSAIPILKFIASSGRSSSRGSRSALPRLTDVDRRLRIEKTAMMAVARLFADRGYEVVDVSMDRVGWDLEARRKRSRLLVEVKGTSLDSREFVVEVTPNEYAKMTSEECRASYRFCVVTSCEATPEVAVFGWSSESRSWSTGDGERHIEIEERIAARVRPRSR